MNEESKSQDTRETLPASSAVAAEAPPVFQAPRPLDVKLKLYEGPLDLLLDIIRKNEIDIYDIPMTEITGQYLEYLNQIKLLDLDIAGEFLVMAATLIYIKSRMLLPQGEAPPEEEGEDPRQELVRKLLEYQAFKEAARALGAFEDERAKEFTRQIADYYFQDLSGEAVEIDAFSANLYDLLAAFQKVMKGVSAESFHEVFQQVISIEDKIAQLKSLLASRSQVRFQDLFSGHVTRNELVVTFLAILELARTRFIRVVQEKQLGEIALMRRTEEGSEAA